MSNFDIIIGGVWNEVSDTKSQSARIRQISNEVRNCADSLNTCVNNAVVVDAVRRIASNILEEAAREESFSNALKAIPEIFKWRIVRREQTREVHGANSGTGFCTGG